MSDPGADDPTTRALVEAMDEFRRESHASLGLADALDAWHAAHDPQPRTERVALEVTVPGGSRWAAANVADWVKFQVGREPSSWLDEGVTVEVVDP